jgi:hypothetical protein
LLVEAFDRSLGVGYVGGCFTSERERPPRQAIGDIRLVVAADPVLAWKTRRWIRRPGKLDDLRHLFKLIP